MSALHGGDDDDQPKEIMPSRHGDNEEKEGECKTDLQADVEDALLFDLDKETTREYFQALKKAPTLVQNETPVQPFLRCERMNATAAAKRLAYYWKYRFEVYGPDRWLRPMTQTGAGTLTPDQVEWLRKGAIVPSQPDVVLCNISRLPAGADPASMQVVFYVAHMMSTMCPHTQTKGLTVFHAVHSGHAPSSSYNSFAARPGVQKLVRALPFRIKDVVVAQQFDYAGRLATAACQQQQVLERHFLQKVDFIAGPSLRNTLFKLEERGLDRSSIPYTMGGDFFYSQQFHGWIRQRLTMETDALAGAAPPIFNTTLATGAATAFIQNARQQAARQRRLALMPAEHENEKEDNEKDSKPLATSQQRQSKPVPTGLVKKRAASQRQPMDASTVASVSPPMVLPAKSPNHHAEHSHHQQQEEEEEEEHHLLLVERRPGESEDDFYRRRANFYNRRAYQKRRRNVTAIRQECEALQRHNEELRREEQRLLILLQDAHSLIYKASERTTTKARVAATFPSTTAPTTTTPFIEEM